MPPIFMLGTQRSGSNLLRLMLNQLDDIAAPHPPHILDQMLPIMHFYGDLSDDESYTYLIDDVCRLVELNPVIWEGLKLNRHEVSLRAKSRSLLSVYEAIYDIYAEKQGAKTWCCKSLSNIKHVEKIESYFEGAKYIYIYRDGRDVALSFQKAIIGDKHIYNLATQWVATQQLALEVKERVGEERFYCISYESLIQEPEASIKSLCVFLDVKYTQGILDFYKSQEAINTAKSSSLWANLTQPVMTHNNNKFLSEMSSDEIALFESLAGNILDILGYDRSCVLLGEEKVFSKTHIDAYNSENRRMILAYLLKVDKCDIQHRAKQTELLDQIKTRFVA